jgi:Tol biopolymer transport system component
MGRTPARRLALAWHSPLNLLLVAAALAFAAGTVAAQSQLPGTALTTDPAQDVRPSWSPDGRNIAFQSSRSGSYDILLMDADGSNQRFLVQDPADNRRPAWSPDGQWIVFDSDRSGLRNIWAIDINGENLVQLTDTSSNDTFASWSPDGGQVAYYAYESGQLDLWVITLGDVLVGGEMPVPHRLTSGLADERNNQCTFACHTADWSPDGEHLVFTGDNHSRVWVVDRNGQNARVVDGGQPHEHFPRWTPDGRILFLSERVTSLREPVNDIRVMNVDGSNVITLFEAVPHGGPLEFQPDGDWVIYHSPRSGNFDIYVTVLGQEPPVLDTAPQPQATGDAGAAVVPQATQPAAVPPAPAQQVPARSLGLALAVAGLAGVVLLAIVAVVFFLVRRGRAS